MLEQRETPTRAPYGLLASRAHGLTRRSGNSLPTLNCHHHFQAAPQKAA
ncbi:hypothetical protein [Kingella sp. (in: b-proteobacteria)]|nr:hypothetical protein [Kingella sp. (in: b-proteobacteria)]MDO4658037.1 hypothetical protein [Kingella sp. (in: b-proteobacteria)]